MTDDVNKIKVFASDDNLKSLGELLSNETSRKIIVNLMSHKMYTNEIATKLDMRVSLVIHHLKKMEALGLLEITNQKIKRKGEEHRFFKMNSDIFVTLDKSKEDIKKKGILTKIFREGIKFGVIGITAGIIWITDILHYGERNVTASPFNATLGETDSIILSLFVIIVGLIIERVFVETRKKRRMVS